MLAFALLPGAAMANDVDCVKKGRGFRSAQILDHGEPVSYAVRMKGLKWRLSPYGYHAPAILHCPYCAPGMSGLLRLAAHDSVYAPLTDPGAADRDERRYPRSAAARIARDAEHFSYPIIMVSGESLTPLARFDNLEVGDFKGYAVFYKANILLLGKEPETVFHIFALSLSDDCLFLDVVIQSSASVASEAESVIEDILSRLVVERLDGDKPIQMNFNERIGGFLDWMDFEIYKRKRRLESEGK